MDLQIDLAITGACACAYGAIFTALNRFNPFRAQTDKERFDSSASVISMINVLMVLPCALRVLYDTRGENLWYEPARAATKSSAYQEFGISMLSGYCIFHFCAIFRNYQTLGDPLLMVHHVVVACSVTWAQSLHIGTFYLCALGINEISTIPLNLRYLMLYTKMQESRWYALNGVALLLTFFVFRVVAIGFVLQHVAWGWREHAFNEVFATHPQAYGLVVALTALLTVHFTLNLLWFLQVAKHAKRGLVRLLNSQPVNDSENLDSYGSCEEGDASGKTCSKGAEPCGLRAGKAD